MDHRKYFSAIVHISHDTKQEDIEAWYESAKNQTMYQWTEHVLIYETWKKILGKFKPKKNFRILKSDELYLHHPDSIIVEEWNVSEIRDNRDTEAKLENLWLKMRKGDATLQTC